MPYTRLLFLTEPLSNTWLLDLYGRITQILCLITSNLRLLQQECTLAYLACYNWISLKLLFIVSFALLYLIKLSIFFCGLSLLHLAITHIFLCRLPLIQVVLTPIIFFALLLSKHLMNGKFLCMLHLNLISFTLLSYLKLKPRAAAAKRKTIRT